MTDVPRPSLHDWPVNRDRHRAWWEDNPGQLQKLKNERDRQIVEQALGLEGNPQLKLSYRQIGCQFGISVTRVIQIVHGAPGRSGTTEKEKAALRDGAVVSSDLLIEELGLGMRSYNILKDAGLQTAADLIKLGEAGLLAIPRFGKKRLDEVAELLGSHGFSLRDS